MSGKKKKLRAKCADASSDGLSRIARICGFAVIEGAKHAKVQTSRGVFITTIPRHSKVKRETAKGILKRFNEFGADIEIF